jgi:5'-nucleotidase
MSKPILYIDMDDTMCDFTTAKNEAYELDPNLLYPWSVSGFFENLQPIEGVIDAIKRLEEFYDIWILTSPSVRNPLSYTEKRLWIEKYLGLDYCYKLIISTNKSLLKGYLLIDDYEHNFDGIQILFGEDCHNWKEVYDLCIEILDRYHPVESEIKFRAKMIYPDIRFYKMLTFNELIGYSKGGYVTMDNNKFIVDFSCDDIARKANIKEFKIDFYEYFFR